MSADPETIDLISRLAVALAIGLLTGIERGWRERDQPSGGRTAGIRTFALIGLLGGVGGALFERAGATALAALLIAFGGAFAWFKFRESGDEQDYSVTSVVAALLVFALGAFAVVGDMQAAVFGAVAMVVLLAARTALHAWVERLTWPELRSGVLLVAMTFLALPLLPDRTIDPWDAINLHELWLLTILIAAISAFGYIAIKVGGPTHGLIFAGLAGGLVSSTATTLTIARRAKQGGSPLMLAAAAGVASLTSYVRVLAVGIALAPVMWPHLSAALVPAALVLGLACALVMRRGADGDRASDLMKVDNPVELRPVLTFALLLAGVLIATKLVTREFGDQSFVQLAALTGLADVDAVTLAAAKLARQGQVETATIGVLVVVAVNMLVKSAIGFIVGGTAFGSRLAAFLIGSLLVGGAGYAAFAALGLVPAH